MTPGYSRPVTTELCKLHNGNIALRSYSPLPVSGEVNASVRRFPAAEVQTALQFCQTSSELPSQGHLLAEPSRPQGYLGPRMDCQKAVEAVWNFVTLSELQAMYQARMPKAGTFGPY